MADGAGVGMPMIGGSMNTYASVGQRTGAVAMPAQLKPKHPHRHKNLGKFLHPKKKSKPGKGAGIVGSSYEGSPAEERTESPAFERKEDAKRGY